MVLRLDQWEERLPDSVRRIVVRGTHLDGDGAANLRFAYLSVKLLLRRIDLDKPSSTALGLDVVSHERIRVESAAEEILYFIQDLEAPQLTDFWLPTTTFTLASTTTLLLRIALEGQSNVAMVSQSSAFNKAKAMLEALRSHRDSFGWELGDTCLAQCSEVVDRISTSSQPEVNDAPVDLQQVFFNEIPFVDDLFPNWWDIIETS
ncbi:hypothetical protein H2203_001103 [Taxawa tesnikishii (nom. ined.)]|nr:hypothetical protein H2203_001103 [Dothideales sp. JES 119]